MARRDRRRVGTAVTDPGGRRPEAASTTGGERLPSGSADHTLQLFDDGASVAGAVSDYVLEGERAGDAALIVARARHWQAIARQLKARGCSAPFASGGGRFLALEAETVLPRLLWRELPDAGRFDLQIATPLRQLASSAPGVRVYGELVDLLAEQGRFSAAEALEHLWNGLREELPFTLLCGYSSVCFGAPDATRALQRLCHTHTRATAGHGDVLGAFLLAQNLGPA